MTIPHIMKFILGIPVKKMAPVKMAPLIMTPVLAKYVLTGYHILLLMDLFFREIYFEVKFKNLLITLLFTKNVTPNETPPFLQNNVIMTSGRRRQCSQPPSIHHSPLTSTSIKFD